MAAREGATCESRGITHLKRACIDVNGVATIDGPGDRQRSRTIFGDESVVKGCAERQVPVLGTISDIKLDITRSLHVHEAAVDARDATARAGGGDIEVVGRSRHP